MASETADPIDRSHPPAYTGQYLLSSTYFTLQCGLQVTRLAAESAANVRLQNARPTHCPCGHSGYKVFPIKGYSTLMNGSYIRSLKTLQKRALTDEPTKNYRLRKIMLRCGAIISATYRNKGNTSKGSTPHVYKDRVADTGVHKFGRPKNCTYRLRETR